MVKFSTLSYNEDTLVRGNIHESFPKCEVTQKRIGITKCNLKEIPGKDEFRTSVAKHSSTPIRDQPPQSPIIKGGNLNTGPSPKSVLLDNDKGADAGAGLPLFSISYPFEHVVLRSDEINPSVHQLRLPNPSSLLMYTRICNFVENTSNSDTMGFVGLSHISLEGMINRNDSRQHNARLLLESAEDLSVEGFVQGIHDTKVVIFSTQKHRKFIVAFQGPPDLQLSPVTKAGSREQCDMGGRGISHLHTSFKVHAGVDYCRIYFARELETRVFSILENLSTRHPFCDVVMIGHSFGAGLATLSSIRYAGLYPMMTVFCRCFGSPRIGNNGMRNLAHSLPNLNIIRVENGQDLFVDQPREDHWLNIGHTITLMSKNDDSSQSEVEVLAYRFGKGKPISKSKGFFRLMNIVLKNKSNNGDQKLKSYIRSIERFTHMGNPWIKSFVGEEGKGISGLDNEVRRVV